MKHLTRRELTATAGVALWSLVSPPFCPANEERFPLRGRIRKSLKWGMIKTDGEIESKFELAKTAGFDGLEINAPGFDIEAGKRAIEATGLPVDGSVCARHWAIRHSDPDSSIREQALQDLKNALQETRELGGDTVLLVPGHGKDGTAEEVWKRSTENIAKAVPLAEELGVTIAIENVWNHFCYDHDGGPEQTADAYAKFCDAFDSPQVAMQFDLGNHWKYGPTGDWIRTLGKRVKKLDIKGFSRASGKFTRIGEGDIDWEDIRKALTEIDYRGWCAAEVGGGDVDRLREIGGNMDRVLVL